MRKYVKIISMVLTGLVLLGVGITYAFFNFSKAGNNNKLIAGSLYLTMNEGTDSINISNMLPETKEEARSRTDNTLTFTLKGKNTSVNKAINYEILLNDGTDNVNNEKQRIDDKYLVFDLVQIGENDEETYILDAVSYEDLTDQKIWIDKVSENTTNEVEITYKLRVWVSDSIIISDSDNNRDYTTAQFGNLYASVKVAVEGDLEEKILPLTVTANNVLVQNGQSYVENVIKNVNSTNNEDTFNLTITSSNSNVDFEYNNDAVINNISNTMTKGKIDLLINDENELMVRMIDNEPSSVNSFSQNFTIQNNKKVTFRLYLVSVNGRADSADLTFTLTRNGSVVQELVKHVTVDGLIAETTVTYDCTTNGGTTTNASTTVNYGDEVNLARTCTKSGWNFVGWSSDANSTKVYSNYKMNSDSMTLYAIYRKDAINRTITFYKNNNSAILYDGTRYTDESKTFIVCTIPAAYNNAVQATSCTGNVILATIEAHDNTPTALGWSAASNDRNIVYANTERAVALTMNENKTLYAQTRADEMTYTVTYNNNGATGNSAANNSCTIASTYNGQQQAASCSVTLASAPSKTAKVFNGWTSSADSSDYAAGSSYTLTGNVTMTAKWRNIYASDLQYDNNNSTFAVCTSPNNNTVQCALDVLAEILND